ncbi:MAG: acyl carrier protein [Ruminococcaceae bacterium]|nr:acyl carrier protein [Oscillospiraceae bacterium]
MNIEEKVKGILSELSGQKSVEVDATLQGDLAFDSILMVTMLVQIEDVFGIELDESDMNPFELNTVQSVISMVNRYFCNESD